MNLEKKKYYIFIWKHITAFSILSLLTMLFFKTNHISRRTAFTIIAFLFICLLIVLVVNHYIFKKRNVISNQEFENIKINGVNDNQYGICNPNIFVTYEREYLKLGDVRITVDKDIFYQEFKKDLKFHALIEDKVLVDKVVSLKINMMNMSANQA